MKTLDKITQLIETWEEVNINLALSIVESDAALRQQVTEYYAQLLEFMGEEETGLSALLEVVGHFDFNAGHFESYHLFDHNWQPNPITQKILATVPVGQIQATSSIGKSLNWIFNLKKLNLLNLRNQFIFEYISSDEEFEKLSNLTNLQELNLCGVQLKKLPQSIGALQKLKRCYLDGNHLTELPPGFFSLTNLEELSLSDNNFSQFPNQIENLKNLHTLDLTRNERLSNEEIKKVRRCLPHTKVYH